jgi:hypothetical protein
MSSARGLLQHARVPSTAVLADLVAACRSIDHRPIGSVPQDWVNELLKEHAERRLVQRDYARVNLVNTTGYQGLLAARGEGRARPRALRARPDAARYPPP